jgi:hypothetical protein
MQMQIPSGDDNKKSNVFNGLDGGHSRIRTYDFHRVKVALYR